MDNSPSTQHITTMKHYITLPNNRRVSVGTYANAWKTLKSLSPDALMPGFDYLPERADVILRKMREGLHDRINKHLPPAEYERIRDNERFYSARRLATVVNSRLIIRESTVRHLPRKLVKRVAHRITPDHELN